MKNAVGKSLGYTMMILSACLLLLTFTGCGPPSGNAIKKHIEKQTECKVGSFSAGKKKKQRNAWEYTWRGTIDCSRSNSHLAKYLDSGGRVQRKYDTPTPVNGTVRFARSSYFITWEMVKYDVFE